MLINFGRVTRWLFTIILKNKGFCYDDYYYNGPSANFVCIFCYFKMINKDFSFLDTSIGLKI